MTTLLLPMKSQSKIFIVVWMCAVALARTQSTLAQVVAPRALPAATGQQLRALLADPAIAQAHVGVSIVALGSVADAKSFPSQPYADKSQPMLWQQDANRRFLPASNTKLYTSALALKYLGAKRTFATSVQSNGVRDQSTLKGAISLVGGGDPSLKTEDLKSLSKQVFDAGIRHIEGDIIGDGTAFNAENMGGRYPDGWTLDDTLWYYGPEVSALAINRNQVDVTIEAATPGQAARVIVSPDGEDFAFRSTVKTVASTPQNKQSTSIRWERADDNAAIGQILSISGQIVAGEKNAQGLAVPDPARRAAQLFKRALQAQGIAVTGIARSQPYVFPRPANLPRQELARHESAPLATLLAGFMKPSDNLYGEMLLRATYLYAYQGVRKADDVASQMAHGMMFDWLKESGVDITGLQFTDGSGLSRYNLITPRATTGLLAAAEKLPDSQAFWNALPIAGVDGTLRRRMVGTPEMPDAARDNVRAKTGSFSIVSTLSGYVTTRDRHRLAVSVLCNFTRGDDARRVQNQIFSLLASTRLGE